MTLLGPNDPAPVLIERAAGASPFVLVCDHAGRAMPERLGDLGVAASEFERHVAWDIGALGVAQALSAHLDAVLVAQRYSRLVIDCNRPEGHPGSIPTLSERTAIPGNRRLAPAAAEARRAEILRPYQAAVADVLAHRRRPGILVAVHSFTPVYLDEPRAWQAGVLYTPGNRFAESLLALLRQRLPLPVGDNEPYALSQTSDYTVPLQAERRGLANVELEIRQDLIADAAGQRDWALTLAELLPLAAAAAGLEG